jgi:hypothetical protein
MINPAQNQPPNPSVPNAVIGSSPPEKKPRQLLPSKFSLLFGAAAIVAIVLGVILAFVLPQQKQQLQPSQTPQDANIPKVGQQIVGVNGKILAIKKDGNKTIFEASSYSTPWQKKWQVTISEKTILVDEKGWQANSLSGNSSVPGVQKPTNKTAANLTVKDFKVGDVIYMMANQGQDFQKDEIDGPAVIVKLKL